MSPFLAQTRVSPFVNHLSEKAAPPSPQEQRDARILEFQRLAARLAHEQVIHSHTATTFMRMVNRDRRDLERRRQDLPELVLALLLAIEQGTLKEGEHFTRPEAGRLAFHLESVARPLFQAHGSNWTAREMRRLFKFGARNLPHVVVARSGRTVFAANGRCRVVVLDEAFAYEFVGYRKKVVPLG